jgi:predicted O-methyltransferase YrrM
VYSIKTILEQVWRYVKYLSLAKYKSGHGIHSHFLFQLAIRVIYAKSDKNHFSAIKRIVKRLGRSRKIISVNDKGAGSSYACSDYRKVREIVKNGSTSEKFGMLFSRLVEFFQPNTVIELGTSLGIGSLYLAAKLNPTARLFTIEASDTLLEIANENFRESGFNHIKAICGTFETELPELLDKLETVDMAYIDGNHRKEPVIRYFECLLKKINNDSILIFDDIHWSVEMEEAWLFIVSHPEVRLSLDLFQAGIVFFRKELSKEHFILRF